MLPPLAEPTDLAPLLGDGTINEGRAEAALQAASALVRTYTCDWVDAQGFLRDDIPDGVTIAVLNIGRRVYLAPDSSVTQETIGPYSVSKTGGLWLSNTDRVLLDPYRSGGGNASLNPQSMTQRWGWSDVLVPVQGEQFSDPVNMTAEEFL